MKIDLTIPSHHNCPSFDRCNTNKCPLHPDYSKLKDDSLDKGLPGWKRCRANKLVRMRIAKAFRLKSLGLSDRERANLTKSLQMKKQIFSTQEKQTKLPLNDNLGQFSSQLNEGDEND